MYPGTTSRRLDSWKEIAAYLGRDVRTVIRWEKERGLPVRRDTSSPGRPTVFAEVEELEQWLVGQPKESVPNDATPSPAPVQAHTANSSSLKLHLRTIAIWSGAVLLTAALLITGYEIWYRASERHLRFVRTDFPAAAPMSVGIADFDRDGIPDILFTNAGGDTVDVLFGDGTGSFLRRTSVPSAKQPERLTIDDFNRDGIPDFAVTHRGSHDLTVFLGNGHGGFRETFRWGTEGRSRWVTSVDLDNDGNADLVVACSAASKVAILLGRGDGTFSRIQQYASNGESSAVAAGDFNHDHFQDIITADYQFSGGKTVTLYAGKGDGTFRPPRSLPTGFGPLGITAADLNRDGLLDIVTADFRDDISILLAEGDGFMPPQIVPAPGAPGFVAAGDFDGDANPDLLMVAEHSNDAHIYYGDGRGRFSSSQIFSTAAYPDAIATGDLDGDGKLDFVVGATYGNAVSVYLNRTDQRVQGSN